MFERMMKYAAVLALIVFAFFFFCRPVEFEDVWLHIKAGEWILGHQAVPRVDPFSFDAVATPWIFQHWLGSLAYALVFRVGGLEGLKFFRLFLFAGIFALFFLYARRRMPLPALLFLVLTMMTGMDKRAFLKPDVFNYIFLQALLIFLLAYQEDGIRRRLFWVPVLGILWGNVHLGGFVYGNMIFGTFILSAGIRALLRGPEAGAARRMLGSLLLTGIFFNGALLANPVGIEGFRQSFRIFLDPACIGFYDINRYIFELRPPVYLLSLSGWWAVTLAAGSVLAIGFNERRRLDHVLLFTVALFSFLYAERAGGFFIFVCGTIIASSFPHLKGRWPDRVGNAPGARMVFYGMVIVLCAVQVIRLFNARVYVHGMAVRRYRLEASVPDPSRCVDVLAAAPIAGNVFNEDRFGAYMIWAAYPRLKPFIDGRFLSQERFGEVLRVFKDPARAWPPVEKKYRIDAVLLDTSKPQELPFMRYLARRDSWEPACLDGAVIAFVKPNGTWPDGVPGLSGRWRKTRFPPKEERRLMERLLREPASGPSFVYVDILEEALTLYDLGYRAAAMRRFSEAMSVDPGKVRRVLHVTPDKGP